MPDFGTQVGVGVHFCAVFSEPPPDHDRQGLPGGFAGYGAHVQSVADRFDGITLHRDVRTRGQLRSSARPLLFVKVLDIANWNVRPGSAQAVGVDFADVLQRIETGEAIAHLAADHDLAQAMGVQGSPTRMLNEGRQKLFGDVGYGILAALVTGLLAQARRIDASRCA